MLENLTFNNKEEKVSDQFPKKKTKRILITISAFLALIGLFAYVILSSDPSVNKKENLKSSLEYSHREDRQLSQTVLKDSSTNYIKAVYDCPGNNEICKFYQTLPLDTLPISSITIDEISVPVTTTSYKFSKPGVKEVIIKFSKQIDQLIVFFGNCEYLISVDLSNLDASKLDNMYQTFENCIRLKNVTFGPNFLKSKVVNMGKLFSNCYELEYVDFANLNTEKSISSYGIFENCKSLKKVDMSSFDVSSTKGLAYIFAGCESLTSIDLSNLKTSKIEYMGRMFDGCSSLETINFGNNFDTSSVTDMEAMFRSCGSLKSLDLSKFNTTVLENADYMFDSCDNLVSIENKFNSVELTSATGMFKNCRKLSKIDLSGLVGKNLNEATDMFYNCNSLSSIDVRNLVAGQVNDAAKIFYNLPNSGNLIYNSLKLNSNFLVTLPSGWTKTDVRFSK